MIKKSAGCVILKEIYENFIADVNCTKSDCITQFGLNNIFCLRALIMMLIIITFSNSMARRHRGPKKYNAHEESLK